MSTRASAEETGRPPGSRPGRQPVAMAPMSPARRGIHARRAPLRIALEETSDSRPGWQAARSPTRMMVPSPRSMASRVCASAPGATGISVAESFCVPRDANGASVVTLRPCLRTALRSRRKTTEVSSSGS